MSSVLRSASIGMPEIVAGIMVVALNAYVLMGGADFGGGVWDLLAAGRRREEQRELIAKSIAPIWEANHVWLIVVVVMSVHGVSGGVRDASASCCTFRSRSCWSGSCCAARRSCFAATGGTRTTGAIGGASTFAIASIATPMLLGDGHRRVASGSVADARRDVDVADVVRRRLRDAVAGAISARGRRVRAGAVRVSRCGLLSRSRHATTGLREDFRARALVAASRCSCSRRSRCCSRASGRRASPPA